MISKFIDFFLTIFFQIFCKIIAILLHYAYLASFCWMLVEGIHLYRLIVIVYGNEKNLKWLYYVIGWGKYDIFLKLFNNYDLITVKQNI